MNIVSKRRLKLFKDAQHYGAKIIKNQKWMAAIAREYDQLHCFGRLKPKVKPGTNIIDPTCNLRKDEGITLKNLKRQESKDEYIKDGIGYDDQEFEAGWPFSGAPSWLDDNDRSWGPNSTQPFHFNAPRFRSGRKNGELCPFIVLMELDTGKLFLTILAYDKDNQQWVVYDFMTERNGFSDGGYKKRMPDRYFKDLMKKSISNSLQGMTGVPDILLSFLNEEQIDNNEYGEDPEQPEFPRTIDKNKFLKILKPTMNSLEFVITNTSDDIIGKCILNNLTKEQVINKVSPWFDGMDGGYQEKTFREISLAAAKKLKKDSDEYEALIDFTGGYLTFNLKSVNNKSAETFIAKGFDSLLDL